MANICYTEVVIFDSDKEKIKKLYEMILEATRETRDLKVITDTFNLSKPYTRGEISFIQLLDNNRMILSIETAWSPDVYMWIELTDTVGIGQEIVYYTEEFGCGILQTNNANYIDMYYIDSATTEIESIECASEEEVKELLCGLLNVEDKPIDELKEDLSKDEKYSELVFIHEWEYIPLEEC